MTIESIISQIQNGELSADEAREKLLGVVNLGHSQIDTDRLARTGSPEIIFAENKTPEQICDIASAMIERGENVLATRVPSAAYGLLRRAFPSATIDEHARTFSLIQSPPQAEGCIALVAAGTSDLPVAAEAAATAEFYGYDVSRFYDVGVAGIHRLFAVIEEIRKADVVIVTAGMEGALPSVIGGLVSTPVIAVPTSVGYGVGAGGYSALMGMLGSCASGLSVVNIDNGFGAAACAHRVLYSRFRGDG